MTGYPVTGNLSVMGNKGEAGRLRLPGVEILVGGIAILLLAGDKSGGSEKRFYKQFIAKADERLDFHLARLKKGRK